MADASIQKRAPIHTPVQDSPKRSNRSAEEAGSCIYLTRHSVLSHVAERVEKELENGKNSKYILILLSLEGLIL